MLTMLTMFCSVSLASGLTVFPTSGLLRIFAAYVAN
jgi:hypothetical protein